MSSKEEEQEQQEEQQEQGEQKAEKKPEKKSKKAEKKSKKKKKRSRRKYSVSIPKAIMMVRPVTDISPEAMEIVTSFVNSFVEDLAVKAARLANEAARLAKSNKSNKSNKRAMISIHDIDVAIPLILATELAKRAAPDGSKTVPNDAEAAPTDIPCPGTTVSDSSSDISFPRHWKTVPDSHSDEASEPDANLDEVSAPESRSDEATAPRLCSFL